MDREEGDETITISFPDIEMVAEIMTALRVYATGLDVAKESNSYADAAFAMRIINSSICGSPSVDADRIPLPHELDISIMMGTIRAMQKAARRLLDQMARDGVAELKAALKEADEKFGKD